MKAKIASLNGYTEDLVKTTQPFLTLDSSAQSKDDGSSPLQPPSFEKQSHHHYRNKSQSLKNAKPQRSEEPQQPPGFEIQIDPQQC